MNTDALLADLQSTTQRKTYSNQGPPRAGPNTRQKSETPPPLPPPPQDIPDTIPPPQQFEDQPLYETQNVRQNYQKRISNSSLSSQGSVESANRPYQRGPSPAQHYQSRTPPPNQGYQPSPGQVPNPASYQGSNLGQGYRPGQGQGMSVISNNLSELDQLLSDLNSAQFMAEVDKKHPSSGKVPPAVAPKPSRGGANTNTVDSLLDQLEGSVPQTPNTRGQYQAPPQDMNSYQSQSFSYSQRQQPMPQHAVQTSSAATQELDDLMSSLSDFKMRDKPPSQQAAVSPMRRSPSPGSEPSYAKPQKSRNLSQSSSPSSSLQLTVLQNSVDSMMASLDNLEDVDTLYSKPQKRETPPSQLPAVAAEKESAYADESDPYAKVHKGANISVTPEFCVSVSVSTDPVFMNSLDSKPLASSGLSTSQETSAGLTLETSVDSLYATPVKREDWSSSPDTPIGPTVYAPKSPTAASTSASQQACSSTVWDSRSQSSSLTGNVSSQGGQLESMLGDLQSDLSKQGVSTKTKGLCAACNQPVVGQVITALGKIWHVEHFACAHCHDALGTKNFYERDGVAYCERDYHALFAPRCAYCNGPIVDKCVTALNCTWHPEHFFCAQCGRPFGDEGFHEKDGKAYCRADFFDMFAPKCGGCGRAIVDNYISALDRHWHPECFACWECHMPFGSGSFFDYEGLPYCETHYHQKRGSLCAGCQKPISGRCITAMYKKFHPEHFVCAFCLKQLNKGTFKEQNDRPYCHPCFVKLFG